MKDLDGAMPVDHFVAQRNYAAGHQEALDLMEGKISATGAADHEREARRAMIEYLAVLREEIKRHRALQGIPYEAP